MKKLHLSQNLIIGSLLFGLFFGAGNLIFPVKMGRMAGSHFAPATLGFVITGVGLAILGIISSAASSKQGLREYASPLGKVASLLFTLALYLTIGPLFAIPRTATVAFEVGIHPFIPGDTSLPLLLYSSIFFTLVLFFSIRPSKILDVVGRFLAPLFLVLLSILLLAVFFSPMGSTASVAPEGAYASTPLAQGILAGYDTMDALASLAFAIIIITNIREFGVNEPHQIAVETARSGLVTVLIMGLLYAALVFLGASSSSIGTTSENGGLILSQVSHHYFGTFGQLLLAAIVSVACLKTAVGLVVSIATTFTELFPRAVSYRFWMFAFSIVSLIIANFGLDSILALSLPVLMFLYPISIALMSLWILHAVRPLRRRVFQVTVACTALFALYDFLRNCPAFIQELPWVDALLTFIKQYLPLSSIGLGWLIPTIVVFLLSLGLTFSKETDLS